ncbi:Outer membrane porin F precursor [Candidatus Venteria ishoeyi]|uniref:Outer membrane porin F n=2 Tax=Candidatus Venteria ishoeyi TaxID=1899563 RepID=A0A1H6F3S0_9GAMM|nr:Outer membrane porin F precursor [Candidatus Venteria ishoeyi]
MFNRTSHPIYMGLVAGALLNVATPAFAVDSVTAKAVADGMAPPVYLVDSQGVPTKSGSHNPKADPAMYDCVIGAHSMNAADAKKYTDYSEFTADALKAFEANLAVLKGCGYTAPDSDKDGVPNYKDKCADTSAGAKVDENGCKIIIKVTDDDSDGDGIPDSRDNCEGTPPGTKVDAVGCETVSMIVDAVLTEDHIRFDFDKAILKPAGKAIVDKMVKFLSGDIVHVKKIMVDGHTDNTGPAKYNMGLSQRRAQSVADYISAGGIPTNLMVITGEGESNPVADNATRKGRSTNRRVEITIHKTNKQ